jgi:hypothetical protein
MKRSDSRQTLIVYNVYRHTYTWNSRIGAVAKWEGKGLQNLYRRFDSAPRLHRIARGRFKQLRVLTRNDGSNTRTMRPQIAATPGRANRK